MRLSRPFWRGIHLPRTLRWQLFLILFAGLAIAHVLSFAVVFMERYMSAEAVMLDGLRTDVRLAIALLNRVPAGERADWLNLIARPNYRYLLGPGAPDVPESADRIVEVADIIRVAAEQSLPVQINRVPGSERRFQAHLSLRDGTPVTILIAPHMRPLAAWLPYVLVAQLALLIVCTWLAVRLAIRPLLRFAGAAEALDPGRKTGRLDENGPVEVAYAATAFNRMNERIAHYLDDRVRILAAISHDLQTPITRMKLRAEIADDSPERDKLINDLSEIERLVREGVAYARSAHGGVEKTSRIDLAAFLESIVFDYRDTGKAVQYEPGTRVVTITRPHALRRILTNLIDNSLKFAGDVEIDLDRTQTGAIRIAVLDRGPGIPEHQLEAVCQPFYRLEQSRNRDTGGTGLGLAIAQQLSHALGGTLRLQNRTGGGLLVELTLAQA
ncbi:signal transduction histidine kinase [Bradyrhizobium sp. AZCC 2262]|uniref:sensor histidine kinase n=1 Tax=Bradyrhizobium sp. AZCC 2262 TaxID=3117022 RepID=UPI002FEFCA8E